MQWAEKFRTEDRPRKFKNINTERKRKFYNMPEWQFMSKQKRMEDPLCCLCSLEDKVEPAAEVHHLIKWDSQTTDVYRAMLLLDKDNIISVCKNCHENIHYRPDELTDKQKEYLSIQKNGVYEKYVLKGYFINIVDDKNFNK